MPVQLTINGGWQQFTEPLRDLVDFDTYGGLKGRAGRVVTCGRLPDYLYRSVGEADYVVYSYNTPIAWHVPGMTHWITPGIKYSVTTSKSQGRIFTALSQLLYPDD